MGPWQKIGGILSGARRLLQGGRRGRAERRPQLLCVVRGGKVDRHVTGQGQDGVGASEQCQSRILLLPKSAYVVRHVKLPKVEQDEIDAMIRLEIEATLPAEYGEVEVAWRRLDASGATTEDFEVYIAKQGDIEEQLEACRLDHIVPDSVLPSAVVWRLFFERHRETRVALAALGGAMEAAFIAHGGKIVIRSIQGHGADEGGGLGRRACEFLRTARADLHGESGPLEVAWLAPGAPPAAPSAGIHMEHISPARAGSGQTDAILHAAEAIDGGEDLAGHESASLLPSAIRDARACGRMWRRVLRGSVAMLLGIAMTWTALRVAIGRYDGVQRELAAKMLVIKREGEAAGQRIAQVEALKQAQNRGKDFLMLIGALYEATPDRVSFSEVSLDEKGKVSLYGQAESVALPFMLPENLEKQPLLKKVVLQSVGQKGSGDGLATDMRLECRFLGRAARE